jgi:RNA polymerase sigma-70 factor (ECF subfamily)
MRASWEALHAGLTRSVRSLQAEKSFATLQQQHPALTRFDDADALVAFLTSKRGDLDEKDALLRALATLAQGDAHGEVASSLLWLGLWPGLDAIHRRRTRLYFDAPDDLVSQIAEAFTEESAALDPTRVQRVAATLVRSTERRVLEARAEAWREARTMQPRGDIWALDEPPPACRRSRLGLLPTLGVHEDLAYLRAWLAESVGDDAELVLGVLVLEETQREAGTRLGLSHDVARKRFQRAFTRLRAHAAKSLSHFGPETRVCRKTGTPTGRSAT